MRFQKPIVIAMYLFLYLPIGVLIAFSFNSESFPAPWDHFTWRWYEALFQDAELWLSFTYSLIIATSSTLISLCMGCLLIFFWENGGQVKKTLPLFFGNLIIPETVLGISLLGYFSWLNIPLGMTTLIFSHTVLGIGLTIPILYARYTQISNVLREASLDLGASRIQTFRFITLPMFKSTLLGAALLIFMLSFDDFIVSYFCAGTHIQTLSLHLLSSIRSTISPVVNALSAILLIFSSGLAVLLLVSKQRKS